MELSKITLSVTICTKGMLLPKSEGRSLHKLLTGNVICCLAFWSDRGSHAVQLQGLTQSHSPRTTQGHLGPSQTSRPAAVKKIIACTHWFWMPFWVKTRSSMPTSSHGNRRTWLKALSALSVTQPCVLLACKSDPILSVIWLGWNHCG